MAHSLTTRMALAMAVATEQNMAHSTPLHSTPLHYSSGHPSIAPIRPLPAAHRVAWMAAPRQIGGGR